MTTKISIVLSVVALLVSLSVFGLNELRIKETAKDITKVVIPTEDIKLAVDDIGQRFNNDYVVEGLALVKNQDGKKEIIVSNILEAGVQSEICDINSIPDDNPSIFWAISTTDDGVVLREVCSMRGGRTLWKYKDEEKKFVKMKTVFPYGIWDLAPDKQYIISLTPSGNAIRVVDLLNDTEKDVEKLEEGFSYIQNDGSFGMGVGPENDLFDGEWKWNGPDELKIQVFMDKAPLNFSTRFPVAEKTIFIHSIIK